MNIGFTGHRNKLANVQSLYRLEQMNPGATWIHGGAEGFDTQVHNIGKELGKVEGETLIVIRPDYQRYPPKVAPLKRNEVIVDRSDLLVACYDGRRIGGTFYTVNYARQKKVPVNFIRPVA